MKKLLKMNLKRRKNSTQNHTQLRVIKKECEIFIESKQVKTIGNMAYNLCGESTFQALFLKPPCFQAC